MDVNDEYETINPWLSVLMQEDWFRDMIREKWTAAYDEGLFSQAVSDVRDAAKAHEAAFARNDDRWGVYRNNAAAHELCTPQDAARTRRKPRNISQNGSKRARHF
jgi:predicted transposase YbfD/YdcC